MERHQRINKRISFKLIALSLPFLFFVILEFALRLFHVGYSAKLFLTDAPNDSLVHNNIYISRLFFNDGETAPNAYVQYFTKRKPENTFRIFVMGESSALGFPYNHRGSFARMLEYMFDANCKEKKVEIINLAVTAINSYALLTFTPSVIRMDPDAILIYTGHNEYYGALGIGSLHKSGINRKVVKMVIQLKKLRLVQLGFHVTGKIRHLFNDNQGPESGLMIKMAGNQEIILNSEIYKKGLQQFECNMQEVLQEFSKHSIPVYFSDLVSNEKDQKPFISKLSRSNDSIRFMSLFRKGYSDFKKNNFESALKSLLQAEAIDSTYAMNNFLIAEILYARQDFNKAQRYYQNAKELDVLRFRAPEDINRIIRKLSKQNQGVYFVQARQRFREKSIHSLLGNDLFTDHLHPNLDGNFLLASAFYKALQESSHIGETISDVTLNSLRQELPVTTVDSLHGTLLINYMKQKWPFFDTVSLPVRDKTYPERLALGLLEKRISWKIAMDSLYKYYIGKGQITEAIRVARAYDLEYPYESFTAGEIGRLYQQQGNYARGFFYYRKAFERSHNIEFARKLVIVLLKMDKPEETGEYLRIIRNLSPGDRTSLNLMRMTENVIKSKQIIQADPDNIESNKILARYYLYIENPIQAKVYIDRLPDTDQKALLTVEFHRIIAKKTANYPDT